MMTENLIFKTREFVKKSFIENPHFSFNHWSVMYNHSVRVEKIAMKITKDVKCDKLLVSMGALLHDIGKTHKADPETLHKYHEDFNWKVSEKFIKGLKLSEHEEKKLNDIISYKSNSIEMKIVKDADALALYADKKLHMLWIEWIVQNKLDSEIKRKLDKFSNLNFEVSKKLGKKWFEQTKQDWDKYIKTNSGAQNRFR
ncbi:MAG: HD domain-containing protein [Candidatus Aenigmarchaeota archaeon]|nr:HD domain-containing protein [Candidatus Aenigmarchaeota archaeon]